MRLIEMVLIVSQLDLQALSKFNYPAFILIVLAIASDLANKIRIKSGSHNNVICITKL